MKQPIQNPIRSFSVTSQMLAATRSHLLYSPLILEFGTSKLVIGEELTEKKKTNFLITHSSDNGKCYFSLFIEQSNRAYRKIKVLYPDQQNKVLYPNILITQAFYCILRLRSVLHLCYHIHGHILQACYIFHILTHSL